MLRVLQIVDHMSMGGIQTFIMNVYRNIDRSHIQFDFLLHRQSNHPFYLEIQSLGGNIFYVPSRRMGVRRNIKELNSFFLKHPEYKVVHMHVSSLSYITPLQVARNHSVPKRIIHSHSSNVAGSAIHRVLHWWHKKYIHRIATDYIACGEFASKWMYGGSKVENKVIVIYNGINLRSFENITESKENIRRELGIGGDNLVIGHVGRFNTVKNHHFLIDILTELIQFRPNSKLILIGEGALKPEIKEYSKKKGVDGQVLFLGLRSDINRLLHAFDVFVLPSYYEGFPIVAVEAQAAGVPVLMSDTISKEVAIKENVKQQPLHSSAINWAREIVKLSNFLIPDNKILINSGFDISSTVKNLSSLYEE